MLANLRYRLWETDSSNSTWSDAFLNRCINWALSYFSTARPFRFMESEFTLTAIYTELSAAYTSGTVLSVDSSLGFSPGVYGYIYSSSATERFLVTSVSGGTINISAALVNDYAIDDGICRESHDLPAGFYHAKSCRDMTFSDSDSSSGTTLKHYPSIRKFDYENPIMMSSGVPSTYMMWGFSDLREPYSILNNLTMDSGSVTSSVVDTALSSVLNDYYNGWVFTNSTRSLASRVWDYNGASQTLYLSDPITSQTTGDVYFLKKNLLQVGFDTLMDIERTYVFRYFRFHPKMINDMDIPLVPGQFIDDVLDLAMYKALRQDGREQRSMVYLQSGLQAIRNLWEIWGVKDQFDGFAEWKYIASDYASSPDADTI